MKSLFTPICAAALLLGATTVHAAEPAKDTRTTEQRLKEAEKRLEEAASEIAELSGSMAVTNVYRMPDGMVFLGRNPNRAMLGISIGDARDNDRDDGVTVLSVSPGGPAAVAGIKAGDVLADLNGKPLKRDKDVSSREKLLAEMGKLSPGDEATLRYLRDGKAATAKLKVDSLPREEMRRMRIEMPNMDHMRDQMRGWEDFRAYSGLRGPLGDMELVALTPKLGQYFGADKGLLVVSAPEDKDIKLEDGDVLLDIDGRMPNDASHAFRILRSYEPGEKVTLNVLRQRKKMAMAITIPKREDRGGRPRVPPAPPPPVVPPPTGA